MSDTKHASSTKKVTKEKKVSRPVRWAAIGAIGLASLFGAPSLARAQQGPEEPRPAASQPADRAPSEGEQPADTTRSPDEAPPAEAAPTSAESQPASAPSTPAPAQLSAGYVDTLSRDMASSDHPVNSADSVTLSNHLLLIHELREALHERPAEGTPARAAADRARELWGDQANPEIDRRYTSALQRLQSQAQAGEEAGRSVEDIFGPNRSRLQAALERVDTGIGEGEERYQSLDSVGNNVTRLVRMLRGGEVRQAPREEDEPAYSPPLPLLERPNFDLGSFVLLTGTGGRQFVAYDAEVTPTLLSMFGSHDAANFAMSAFNQARTVMLNSPNDLARQNQAALALHSALTRIPSDKEIWNHPEFNAAMAALARGDLREGLQHLQNETAFNAVWAAAGNLHHITMSQRAIARIRAYTGARLLWRGNTADFTSYRRGDEDRSFEWDFNHFDIGFQYQWLLMSGYDQDYSVDLGTSVATRTGERRLVEGDGHAFELPLALTLGGSLGIHPMEFTIHVSPGYRFWNMQTTDAVSGSTLTLEDSSFYIGHWGVRADFLGYEGRTWPFRLERVGIGAIGPEFRKGMFPSLNPLAYFTFAGRWPYGEMNRVGLHYRITPYYLLFWGQRFNPESLQDEFFFQHRPGVEVRPIDVSWQIDGNNTLFAGPIARWEGNVARWDQDSDYSMRVHSLEFAGNLGYRNSEYGIQADLRVGAAGEVGGEQWERLPWTPVGSLNVTLSPQMWFSRGSSESGGGSSE